MTKSSLKERAIALRVDGLSYSEILKNVPVAKSTLSLWFRGVGLSRQQEQRLTQKRMAAALRGAAKKRELRIQSAEVIRETALSEIPNLDRNVFWMAGAALYWAEGTKQKEHNISQGVIFSNSDPAMIKFMYKWLVEICEIPPNKIYFEIYIHEHSDTELSRVFWSKIINVESIYLDKIRLKKDKGNSYRKNTGATYHGLLRIGVRKSTNLNRKIMGWVEGLSQAFLKDKIYSGVV